MGWNGYLVLWCAVFGTVALVGFARSLAGVTGAQRMVRVTGRIDRVQPPRNGGSRKDGIAVVVSFQDPSTGEEFIVTNDQGHGDVITAAWTGREIGIRYPPGRPHAYRFTTEPQQGRNGRGLPSCAVILVYTGLVVACAADRGWPWYLIGFGAPLAIVMAYSLPGTIRRTNERIAALAAMACVQGRVIAVVKSVSTDGEGRTRVSQTPVVAFTTHGGTDVTAYCGSGLAKPADSYGRDVTIHYSAADPADFTVTVAARQRSKPGDTTTAGVLVLLFAVAAVVVGAAML